MAVQVVPVGDGAIARILARVLPQQVKGLKVLYNDGEGNIAISSDPAAENTSKAILSSLRRPN